MERTPNKSQHSKLTLEKKILPLLLPGFELATYESRVRRSNQQAVPAVLTNLHNSVLSLYLHATGWECCGLCLSHKLTELAHSFLFCSCVCFCLYGPSNCISFHNFSRQLSVFSLCSSGLTCLFMQASFSPDVIHCG